MSSSFKLICTVLFALRFQSSLASSQMVQSAAQETDQKQELVSSLSGVRIRRAPLSSVGMSRTIGHGEESDFDKNLFIDDYFSRPRRGRLDRMPVTFGKREEAQDSNSQGEVNSFLRPLRDRLNRMPITFGKRNTHERADDGNAQKAYNRMVYNGPTEFSRQDDGSAENYFDEFLIRVAKGSLGRMPLSFGKRTDVSDLKAINNEDDSFQRTARNRLDRMPVTFGKRDSSNHYLHNREVKVHPLYVDFAKEMERPFDIQPQDSSTFSRYQRSKLGRMPLAFGKRVYGSVDMNSNDNYQHHIRSRSKLDRMPVSFGKRFSDGPSSSEASLLDQIDSSATSDELELLKRTLFDGSGTNDIPSLVPGAGAEDEDANN